MNTRSETSPFISSVSVVGMCRVVDGAKKFEVFEEAADFAGNMEFESGWQWSWRWRF